MSSTTGVVRTCAVVIGVGLTIALLPIRVHAEDPAGTEAPPPSPPSETPPAEPTEPSPAPAEPAPEQPAEPTATAGEVPPAPETPPAAPTPPPPRDLIEEIVVTGSRIARDNLQEFAPVTVVTAQQIAESGITTIDDLLRELPSVTLQGISKNNNNGGEGLAWIDLRNLGVQRTLVLINGRRAVATSTGVSDAVDLNTIPLAMIDRVEILLDGASAVYGSDAVAGVVNVILKDNFEGVAFETFGGITDKADGEEWGGSATAGIGGERGNVTFSVGYLNRDKVAQRHRDWAREPVVFEFFNNDVDDSEGVTQIFGSSATPEGTANGVFFRPEGGRSFQPFDSFNLDKRYNYGQDQWLIGAQQRLNATLIGHYDLLDDSLLTFFGEGMFTYRLGTQRLSAQPLGLSGTDAYPAFEVPVTNPFMPDDFKATLDPGTTHVTLFRRMTDVGGRLYNQHNNTLRVVLGLKGVFLEDYDWEVFWNYGRSQTLELIYNSINLTRAFQTADPELCARYANLGCRVGDWFGANELQEEVKDYIRYTDDEVTIFEQLNVGAVVRGDVWKIPFGGDIGAAVGFEYRGERGMNQPSAITVGGDSSGNGLDPTAGQYTVVEAFGEVSVPLVRDIFLLHELRADFAARLSSYTDTFGSEGTYRVAASWAPTADVRVRGIYSTAFRAPSISDLFGGSADSFETLDDPCNNWELRPEGDTIRANCEAQGVPVGFNQNLVGGSQIRTNIGGNPDLGPERAEIANAGVVFTPTFFTDWLSGFSATTDFYWVRVGNAIDSPEPQFLLNSCYESEGLSSPNCALITRGANGAVNSLNATAQNIGRLETWGIDYTLQYLLDLKVFGVEGIGKVLLGFQGNHLFEYDEEIEGTPVQHFAGTLAANSGSYTRNRWSFRQGFIGDDNWAVLSTLSYIGAANLFDVEPGSVPTDSVSAVVYWDLSARYSWRGMSAIFGVDNVLDQDPPFIPEGGQNASAETYDFRGRFFYLRLGYQL